MRYKNIFSRNFIIGVSVIVILLTFVIGVFYLNIGNTHQETPPLGEKYTVIRGVNCIKTKKDNKKYCQTTVIPYYDTEVKYKEPVTVEILNKNLLLTSLDTDALFIFREAIRRKALDNCKELKDRNKRSLAKTIIKTQNREKTNNNEELLEDIAELTQVTDYLSIAERVVKPNKNQLKRIPQKIIKKENIKIKYAVLYWGGIINYYSNKGKLVLKEYRIDGVPYRYQSYDDDNNFYTYDSSGNIVEYSKSLNVYNSNNQLIYITSNSAKDYPKLHDEKDDAIFLYKERTELLNELEKKNSKIHKALTAIFDKYYDKGDYNGLIKDLESYFNSLQVSDRTLFNFYKNHIGDNVITINIAKVDDNYIFSINRVPEQNNDKVIASMANTINSYHGQCAEPSMKAKTGNKLTGKYFYDISLFVRKNSIIVKEHPPCSACNRNISLWGWKYPKTTIKEN